MEALYCSPPCQAAPHSIFIGRYFPDIARRLFGHCGGGRLWFFKYRSQTKNIYNVEIFPPFERNALHWGANEPALFLLLSGSSSRHTPTDPRLWGLRMEWNHGRFTPPINGPICTPKILPLNWDLCSACWARAKTLRNAAISYCQCSVQATIPIFGTYCPLLSRASSVYLISPHPGCISREGDQLPGDNGYLPLGHRRGVTKP